MRNTFRSGCTLAVAILFLAANAHAQVNSGSNGSDGDFNLTTNTILNMAVI
jgi:hypothetical protein